MVEQVVAGTLPVILPSDGVWYEPVRHLFHLMRDHFLRASTSSFGLEPTTIPLLHAWSETSAAALRWVIAADQAADRERRRGCSKSCTSALGVGAGRPSK